jgi:uncharacterized membrane protein
MDVFEQSGVDPERAWLAAFLGGIAALVVGSLVFTKTVFDGFIWRYFWGPVRADAEAAACAVKQADGSVTVIDTDAGCSPTQFGDAIVSVPGYTTVSTLGYMVILVFMLVGVYFLLRRIELEPYREFLYALVPFMLFGGALRVVEDATDAIQGAGMDPLLDYPLNTLLISPVIYGTVFLLALGSLLLTKALQNRELTSTYYYPLAGMGIGALLVTLTYLVGLAVTTEPVEFHPLIVTVVVALASLIALAVYVGVDRWRPSVNAGTGLIGLIVLWAHAIDGVANVAAADWVHRFYDLGPYGSKHVFNRLIIDLTEAVQPQGLSAAIGTSWPFLVVKIAVAAAIVSLFDDDFISENPRYSIMLLGAIIAVGLGPGTRDVLRVTFGI